MVRQGKFTSSSRINICYSKIRTTQDIDDLASIFNPHISATGRRDAWFKIFKALRDAPNRRLRSLEHLAEGFVTPATLWKTRKEMRAVGLIDYRDGYWKFSKRIFSNLLALMNKIEELMEPVSDERKVKDEVIARAKRSRKAWERMLRDEVTDYTQDW